jgi:hypothetical protein
MNTSMYLSPSIMSQFSSPEDSPYNSSSTYGQQPLFPPSTEARRPPYNEIPRSNDQYLNMLIQSCMFLKKVVWFLLFMVIVLLGVILNKN